MTTQLFDLTGKVALVTGASRGIGESIAKLLAEQGAHIIVSSRRAESCDQVVADIKEAGGSAETMACHIGDMENIAETFANIKDKHGKLDILVNNTVPAISSGSAWRFIGMVAMAALCIFSLSNKAPANLVLVKPGNKALQRILNCAHSLANDLVILITAAFVIE